MNVMSLAHRRLVDNLTPVCNSLKGNCKGDGTKLLLSGPEDITSGRKISSLICVMRLSVVHLRVGG